MEPDNIDQLVLDWCKQNGWELPQQIKGRWWAIAPNSFIPEPIPSMLPLTININLAEIQAAFERFSEITGTFVQNPDGSYAANLDLGGEGDKQDRNTLSMPSATIECLENMQLAEACRAIERLSRTCDSFRGTLEEKRRLLPESLKPELSPAERIKKRDALNKAKMRGFLGSRFPSRSSVISKQ